MDATLDGLLLFVPLLYVWLAPYTKVEESFNLHATHDVIMYGIGPNGLQNVSQNLRIVRFGIIKLGL
jgi:alpha-1,6-mannosyltransferase